MHWQMDVVEHDPIKAFPDMLGDEVKDRADFARAALREGEEVNRKALGKVPPHTTTVDGHLGAREETVRPNGGLIVYEFKLVVDVFAWIADMLAQHSPVLTGRYRASHRFYAGGVEADPDNPPEAGEYFFASTVPYARKIEHSRQVPNGVYEVVAALAARRFGNIVRTEFNYRDIDGLRQPAVVITMR